jgi:hypothetical protein
MEYRPLVSIFLYNLLFLAWLLGMLAVQPLQGQTSADNILAGLDISTDSVYNFNPVLDAALTGPGRADLFFFNLLQSRQLDFEAVQGQDTVSESYRSVQLVQILQLNYGLKLPVKINAGIDLTFLHSHLGNPDSGWPELLMEPAGDRHLRTFYTIAPRIRLVPLASLPELSWQSALHIPLIRDDRKQLQTGADRVSWENQLIFYQHLFPRFTWQLQLMHRLFFKNPLRRQTSHLLQTGSYFLYRVARQRLYLMAHLNYRETRQKSILGGYIRRDFELMAGAGVFYQLLPCFALSLTGNLPLTYDPGSLTTEIKNGSWWQLNLGLNYRIPEF